MPENWDKLDFIDFLFGVSVTLLLLVAAIYVLMMCYHWYKITVLKKRMYSQAVKTIEDLRVETSLFKHYRQKVDEQYFKRQHQLGQLSDKLVLIIEKLNLTCNEFKSKDSNGTKKDE